jgi:release factor glutamine methyltransferase
MKKEIVLCYLLKKDRSFLTAFSEKEIPENIFKRYRSLVQRLTFDEPLAYVLGFKEFCGLNFYLNKDVLIPRAETEDLVSSVLEFTKGKKLTVVDVGTGSGCIAISLKKSQNQLTVIATDIDERALKVAKKNARLHGLSDQIQFIKSDLLKNVRAKPDIIVANLPYITTKKWKKLSKNIKEFEPKIALDSGKSTLSIYKKLFLQASKILSRKAVIFYEVNGKLFEKVF